MSFDGEQRVAIVRTMDEHEVEDAVLAFLPKIDRPLVVAGKRALGLQYVFGFGETHPVGFDLLADIVDLPWTTVRSDMTEAEIRALPVGAITQACEALDTLRARPLSLARRIAEACQESDRGAAYAMLKSEPREPDPEAAETTGARVAQVFMQLRRAVKIARTRQLAVGIAILIEGY